MENQLAPGIIQEPDSTPVAAPPQNNPDDDAVSLPAPGENQQPLPPQIAQQRATKTKMGLGKVLGKDGNELYQEYVAGNENMLRKEAATKLDFQKQLQRQKDIQDLAATQGKPLDADQVNRIMDPSNPNYAFTDPDTVVEQQYAKNYLSTLNTARSYMGMNLVRNAGADIPQQTADTLDNASDLLAKNQYILTRMQNTEQNLVQEQSWPGYLADQAKQMFQPYVEYKERGLIPDTGILAGIGLGSNLDAQHSTLYRLPFDQFKQQFDTAMDYLEKNNPSLAVSFAKSMLSQNSIDTTIGNAFSALAIPDYAGLGKIGLEAIRKVRTLNQVRRAAADIVRSAATNPGAGPVQAAEGAGDTAEAATQRILQQNTQALQHNSPPLEQAEGNLLSTWQSDANNFRNNPGTYLSREMVTRLADSFVRDGRDLFTRVGEMNRVERTSTIVTNPDAIRAQINKIKQDYKGPANTILDVEGPIKEPESNTYWYKTKIGNYDATQFADAETAEGFARQLGIEPTIKGTAPEVVYLPEAAAKGIQEIKTTPTGTRFYMDHGVEVVPHTDPQPGFVPYNLKDQKFGPKLTGEQARIAQHGLGFHIEMWTPMKENDDLTRDMLIRTPQGNVIPDSISTNSATGTKAVMNSLLGWLRNSDETMSVNESAQRKAATYAQSNVQLWAKGLYQDLEDIAAGRVREDPITGEKLNPLKVYPKAWFGKLKNRQVAKQFERTLDHARRAEDPETGEIGYFFKSPGELQDWYQRNFQRDPSYLETKAYFNFVKLVEGDRMLKEVAEFRNRARLGTEQHSVFALDPETGDKVNSPFFDGIKLSEFPGGEDYVLIMGKNKGSEELHKLGNINTKSLENLRAKVKSGEGKVIQIYDRDHMPLSDWSEVARDKLISYVYTDSAESKPISFTHVNRRGGGHFEWDYDHYLKQADVRPQYNQGKQNKLPGVEHLYLGDNTIMPIKNRKLGDNVAKLWNEAQQFIKNNQWDQARPIVQRLGIKWDEFTGWYHPGRDADGNPTRPRLNANEPVYVVAKNKKINEMSSELQDRYRVKKPDGSYYNTFRDMTKSGPSNNFKVQYNTERTSHDLKTINDIGSQNNPIYAYQPAEMIDPLTTMNRALNRAVNSTFMDDYKIYTVEHWLAEAGKYLDASTNELRSSPFYWFHNPKYRSGIDKAIQWNLESNRYKALQFLGMPSKFDTWMHSLTSDLADKFYENYGPEGNRTVLQKARTVVPLAVLNHVKDPVTAMRSLAFNFKLGLFAIPQFLVQAQTHSLIWALEPRHGTVGTYSMLLHAWGHYVNDEVLQSLDDYATRLNMLGSQWRPGEWLEARRELEKTGFEHVAGEYANINNQLKTRFIQNDFEKGLQLGQSFFRLGEHSNRVTAWYTAFRKFRDANPTTPITNIERSKILNDADLLTVNMSRASSSAINEGIFSLSTQFLTYQIKLAELFLGKRIGATTFERNMARARILTLFTALYGLPNAVGVTGAPFSDNIRQAMMDDLGYIPGEKWWSTMINEGIPAWSMAMITGKLPNVGDRYGSQGFQNIKASLRGDNSWWQAVGGAGVSITSNFIGAALDPFEQYVSGLINGTGYKPTASDLLNPFKEISSVSTDAKVWIAVQTGKWLSRNENYVTDVTPLQATLYGLSGLSPQEQDDLFLQNGLVKGEKDAKKAALSGFIKDWRRGIEAKTNGDSEQGNQYFQNAISRATVAGMSPTEINTAIAISNRGYESAIDQSDQNLWKQGDFRKRDERIEQYKRKLQLDEQGAR